MDRMVWRGGEGGRGGGGGVCHGLLRSSADKSSRNVDYIPSPDRVNMVNQWTENKS